VARLRQTTANALEIDVAIEHGAVDQLREAGPACACTGRRSIPWDLPRRHFIDLARGFAVQIQVRSAARRQENRGL
jgi:hypothetical protein